jgi:CBS domain-containing protein
MGMQQVNNQTDAEELRAFTKQLLRDVRALEKMIDEGMIESGIRRVGAEQELFLVDDSYRPAPLSGPVLEELADDPHFTPELGRFNIEFNLEPNTFGGSCLSDMQRDLDDLLGRAREAAAGLDAHVIMTGILPTLRKADLSLENMTPNPRYRALNDTMTALRGRDYEFNITGADEFIVKHDSVMLEAANTSFQVHFQVSPEEFARLYNIAQVVSAPLLASAVNSPLLFGKRLWHETRIALFQQSVDTRTSQHHLRDSISRVSFGSRWVEDSVLEIYQEDVARFRVLFSSEDREDPFEALDAGRVPSLMALRLHNSTIYRWNRPCYGFSDGQAHLRIENRVLPAGPTTQDEVANAAFWFGLINGVIEEYGDVTEHMDFDDAKANVFAAARQGLGAPIHWLDGKVQPAHRLIAERLVPLAREGLEEGGVDADDIDHYMGIIEGRAVGRRTGATWLLDSLSELKHCRSHFEKLSALTAATIDRQKRDIPVHEWDLASAEESASWRDNFLRVEQFMTTDLFTVNQDELIDLVAAVMDWQHLQHVPVEDDDQKLVGLVTTRALLRLLAERNNEHEAVPVSEVMTTDVLTIEPETLTYDALRVMYSENISCLPVVSEEHKLVGMVTERDFMAIARQLLEDKLEQEG